jgi:hypothetical protein
MAGIPPAGAFAGLAFGLRSRLSGPKRRSAMTGMALQASRARASPRGRHHDGGGGRHHAGDGDRHDETIDNTTTTVIDTTIPGGGRNSLSTILN